MTRCWRWLLLAAVLIPAAAGQALADTRISAVGFMPFMFDNRVYVPVRPTCGYVGADLAWDPYARSAAVVYHNRNLSLVVGTRSAYYNDEPVLLAAPVVIVRNQLCCPAAAFDQYLGIPMNWEPSRHRVRFRGPRDWGYYDVDLYTPGYALGIFAGYGYVPSYYAYRPFTYGAVVYLPLRSLGDVIGAAILLDLLGNRGVVTYGGVQTVLFFGSRRCYYGNRLITLAGPPLICNNVLYVPEPLVANYWRVPTVRERAVWRVRGDWGTRDYSVASRPPGPIHRVLTEAPVLRMASAGLRASGITHPPDPGLASEAARRRATPPSARPARAAKPPTGFPAVAARRPAGMPAPRATARPSRAPGAPRATTRPSRAPAAPRATTRPSRAPAAPRATARPSRAPGAPRATARPPRAPGAPRATTRPSRAPGAPRATARPPRVPGAPRATTRPSRAPGAPRATTRPSRPPQRPPSAGQPRGGGQNRGGQGRGRSRG